MSTQAPDKILFFIASKDETLKIVNTFLSKRNFVVHIETDIKDSIVKIFEVHPDFIFIEWDHSDRKVTHLLKILSDSTASVIVPYITKNTKESIIKFGNCPYNPKLYPPLSGPAIERLVLKANMDDADSLAKLNKFKNQQASKEEILKLQQRLLDSAPLDNKELESTMSEGEATPLPVSSALSIMRGSSAASIDENRDGIPDNLNEIRTEIETRNDLLDQPKRPLSAAQINGLRNNVQEKVQSPIENMINSNNAAKKTTGIAYMQSPTPNASPTQKKSNLIFQKGISASGHPQIIIRQGPPSSIEKNKNKFKVYCISLVSATWCGYFIISTQAPLDYASIHLVFNDWIRLQFDNVFDLTEKDFFEFDDVDVKILNEIQKMSDYSEEMHVVDYEMRVSFFSVESSDMKINFNDEKNYIQLFTRDVPPDVHIDFNLLLHLPENQKYLLYTKTNKALSDDQKNRLLGKNITLLYTSVTHQLPGRPHGIFQIHV